MQNRQAACSRTYKALVGKNFKLKRSHSGVAKEAADKRKVLDCVKGMAHLHELWAGSGLASASSPALCQQGIGGDQRVSVKP